MRAAGLPVLLAACAVAAGMLTTASPALAQEAGTPAPVLTLADAVARALDAAPAVAVARAGEAAARAQLADAEAELAPALFFSGSAFRYQKPTLVEPIHAFRPDLLPSFDRTVLFGDLQLRYDLWDGGARSARLDQRRLELAAAEAAASTAAGAAAARTVSAYLAVRTLDEQIAAHAERLTALAAERDRVGQLLAVGRAAEVDVLQIRAAQAAAEADRATLVANHDRAARDLLRQLGEEMPPAGPPPLVPVRLAEPEPSPRGELLARALAHNGDVERARRELEAAEAAVAAARAGRSLVAARRGQPARLRRRQRRRRAASGMPACGSRCRCGTATSPPASRWQRPGATRRRRRCGW